MEFLFADWLGTPAWFWLSFLGLVIALTAFDLGVLAACEKLLILKMEGWELSNGVRREILFAREKGLLIEELDPPEEKLYLKFLRLDGRALHSRNGALEGS